MNSTFLSLPMTCNFDESGVFRPDRKKFYASAIDALQSIGLEVISPVLNEDWGTIKLDPTEFTRFDVEAITNADSMVVVATEKLSRDIYLEVGLAVGMKKRIFCFIHQDVWTTFMLESFAKLGIVSLHRYFDEAGVPKLIADTIPQVLQNVD